MGGKMSKGAPKRLIVQGLQGSGKTTVLHQLKLGQVRRVDKGVEMVKYKNIEIVSWRVGDAVKRHRYHRGAQAMIFVVDCSDDQEGLGKARDELRRSLNEVGPLACLIYANKQDKENACSEDDLANKLGLSFLRQRWHVQPCVASRGEGLFDGLDWLSSVLSASTKNVVFYNNDDDAPAAESPLDCIVAPLVLMFGPTQGPKIISQLTKAAR